MERRLKRRYPLRMNVRYCSMDKRRTRSGIGWIVNMSSGGVLIAAMDILAPGTPVRASLDWPIPLDETIPLQMVITGTVVRSDAFGFALELENYRFHTMSRSPSSSRQPDQVSRERLRAFAAPLAG